MQGRRPACVPEKNAKTSDEMVPPALSGYPPGAKNGAADAAAICEAVHRPNMRFVQHKPLLQTDI